MLEIARNSGFSDMPCMMPGNGLFLLSSWQTHDWSSGGGEALMPREPSLLIENYSIA